ncbi:NAD-dependent epimerase/dehydratase family protein [Diplonema papillatum]|nr:NAD-dependent epimerase/dehydratase family protein [Diplonema papillatum]
MATVLILGGTGFIGKHLVTYLVDYNLAAKVRVVDKVRPEMAYMDEKFTSIFQNPIVEYVQCCCLSVAGCEKAFGGQRYNIIINLAAITHFGRLDIDYDMMTTMKLRCAKKASELGCDKYVEVSTCSVYKTEGKGEKSCKENHATDPQHVIAKAHLNAENKILAECPDLPVVIVRLPTVYGPADTSGLIPKLTCAASYVGQDEEMMMLYSEDLRTHTLHVQDAVGGIWYIACAGANREIYNLVDKNDTTQKKVNKIIEEIFPIKTACAGHLKTKAFLSTTGDLNKILAETNEAHLENWSELLRKHGVNSCHLTTFLNLEQLTGEPLTADGSKAEALGYQYSVPTMTADYVRHAIQYWVDRKCFPPVLK